MSESVCFAIALNFVCNQVSDSSFLHLPSFLRSNQEEYKKLNFLSFYFHFALCANNKIFGFRFAPFLFVPWFKGQILPTLP